MTEQQKILRVLTLIKLLADKPYKNVKDLALLLGTSTDTVYRYFKLLQELGYHIDKNQNNYYFLFESKISSNTTFGLEETELLSQLISTIHLEHPLREGLAKKVYLHSSLLPLALEFIDNSMAQAISRLNDAIADKKQVRLVQYHSPSSDTIRDRIVEPITIIKETSQLRAFELESNTIKTFKIKRISKVEILPEFSVHRKVYEHTDLFGFTSLESIAVSLVLSFRAYQLLIEEFPEAKPYTRLINNTLKSFSFIYEARSFFGIGRFILGLPGEIIIESPAELKEYIIEKAKLH